MIVCRLDNDVRLQLGVTRQVWKHVGRAQFFLIAALCLCAFTLADARAISTSAKEPTEAYVSLLYGNFYVLPLRTLMRSLIDNSPDVASGQRDRVVIVTGSTSERTIGELESDGIKVLRIPTVQTPYSSDARFDKRFANVMTKLAIFNLTQYERLVFVDADALVLRDMSDVFRCGRFCAVFINPCHFNSGLMVVTPSTETFNDMLKQLPLLPSYDGGDQGFLNSYYPQMLTAPMFDPSDKATDLSQVNFVRLPVTFHMDHSSYYQRFRWDHSTARCGGKMREEEWLGPSFAKPWLWYTYTVLDQSWTWYEYRRKLDNPYPEGTQTEKSAIGIIVLCYLLGVPLLIFGHKLQHLLTVTLPLLSPFAHVRRRYSIIAVLGLGTALWVVSFTIAFVIVPPLVPPSLAYATFSHVKWVVNFALLVFGFGSFGCCGQLSMRGASKGARTNQTSSTNLSLRSIIRTCAIWSALDGWFLFLCVTLIWKVNYSFLMERLMACLVIAVTQGILAFCMLLHLSLLWFQWSRGLPAPCRNSGAWQS